MKGLGWGVEEEGYSAVAHETTDGITKTSSRKKKKKPRTLNSLLSWTQSEVHDDIFFFFFDKVTIQAR